MNCQTVDIKAATIAKMKYILFITLTKTRCEKESSRAGWRKWTAPDAEIDIHYSLPNQIASAVCCMLYAWPILRICLDQRRQARGRSVGESTGCDLLCDPGKDYYHYHYYYCNYFYYFLSLLLLSLLLLCHPGKDVESSLRGLKGRMGIFPPGILMSSHSMLFSPPGLCSPT